MLRIDEKSIKSLYKFPKSYYYVEAFFFAPSQPFTQLQQLKTSPPLKAFLTHVHTEKK